MVATLPVLHGTDVMLVTDAGRLIRVPVDQVRITARQSMGVTLFRLGGGEHVTSVFPVLEDEVPEGDEVPVDGVPVDGGPGSAVSGRGAPGCAVPVSAPLEPAPPEPEPSGSSPLEPTPLEPTLGDPFEAGPADPDPADLQEDPDA